MRTHYNDPSDGLPCLHTGGFHKEVVMGMKSGDKICSVCGICIIGGAEFSEDLAREQDEAQKARAEIARQLGAGVPLEAIAEKFGVSIGALKNLKV